jgi:ferric-dicitrate binding protein FerR (iron transport regulator)
VAAAAARVGGGRRKKIAKLKTTVVKTLGPVATITRDVIAAAKSTSWTTTQSCDGTRVSVAEGVVTVLDRGLHKTKLVAAGGSYFAKRRTR